MKTKLPSTIQTQKQAKKFLTDLYNNNELFHPEDDPADIVWNCEPPSEKEINQLRKLMDMIYEIENFDPCGFCVTYLL